MARKQAAAELDTVNDAPKHSKTKDTFIAAGIKAINSNGVDHISVSAVTELASSTRPTFYSLFGDIDGLLADIWLAHGEWFLTSLADPEFRFEIADAATKERITALLEIFTVSHRKSEVFEVVQPSTQQWWKSRVGNDNYAQLKLAWLAGQRLGSWLTFPIEPKALLSGFAIPFLLKLGSRAQNTGLPLSQLKLPKLSDPKLDSQSVEDLLLESAVKVISRVGVPAASMTRISRNAEVTTGSTYPRFKNIDALVLASFAKAISQIVADNMSKVTSNGFTIDDLGNITTAGLRDSRKVWRNYRVEVHLEGRVNSKLAHVIREALLQTNVQVSAGMEPLPFAKSQREAVAFLVHVIGIGLAILLNAGIPVDELDNRIIIRDMIALFANS